MSDVPEVLREYSVRLTPATASEQNLTSPDSDGLRTKFGGLPNAIQKRGNPNFLCPECREKMRFIAQIDSFEHQSHKNPNAKNYSEQHFMFGDVGMIYVWFCFDCLTPYATMECY